MFSGIVESQSKVIKTSSDQNTDQKLIRILVQRPASFDDLKIGDSICVNGICLTIEEFDSKQIQFCLGFETLSILSSSFTQWSQFNLNLERSLKLGDRVHGHLVTGHVDGLGKIIHSYADGDCWQMRLQVPSDLKNFFWKKGSVCLNGVSLTVNEVNDEMISVCLIPETIAVTNLSSLPEGYFVNVEADYLAKAYFQYQKAGAK